MLNKWYLFFLLCLASLCISVSATKGKQLLQVDEYLQKEKQGEQRRRGSARGMGLRGGGMGGGIKRGQRQAIPVEQCLIKKSETENTCPSVKKIVCSVKNQLEYDNCCLAAETGEKEIFRGPCVLPSRGKQTGDQSTTRRGGPLGGHARKRSNRFRSYQEEESQTMTGESQY